MKNLAYAVGLALCAVVGLQSCGGSNNNNTQALTPRCVLPSDCSGHLICIDRYCVNECVESKDCTGGARCIQVADGNSCQPPEKKLCQLNSDCTAGLVCGIDQQCRNQCAQDVDCPKGQKCTTTSLLCADPATDKDYDPKTNEFKATVDGGTGGSIADGGGTGGTTATDGGDLDAPAADAPATDTPAGDAPVSIDGPGTAVDGVMVAPNSSVRAGEGNITITINQAAGGLSNPTVFDLGGLTVRAQDGGTDTMLVLKVSVPHAAPLGKRTLKFAASGGIFMAADVVEVTATTASPTGLDTNAGSAAAPFRTLKQAIMVSDSGDTIHLIDGTYNIAGGETWGYVIPDNLTIVGDSTAMTIIDGVGAAGNVDGFDASTALTLKTLTLKHFYQGIDMKKPTSTLTLQDVQIASNSYYGIYVEQPAMGSTVTIAGANGLIDQPGQTAIEVYNAPNVTVSITGGTVQGGQQVIQFSYNCTGGKLNVSGTTITQLSTSYGSINMAVSQNTAGTTATIDKATITGTITNGDAKGSMTITGSTITQKSGYGIDFAGNALTMADSTLTMTTASSAIYYSSMQGTMSLKNVTIDGGSYSIQQNASGSAAKLRGSTLKNAQYDGYYLQAGDLDLGTMTESGDNFFWNPAATNGFCLYISRPMGAQSGNPVTSSGTAYGATGPNDGFVPTAGTVEDASGGAVTVPPQRFYLTVGNKLMFY